MAVLGFTFFFSSLFKSTSYSILVTAILFLFAFTLIETLVSALAQIEPWFILTYGAGIIGNVLDSPYPAHIVNDRPVSVLVALALLSRHSTSPSLKAS